MEILEKNLSIAHFSDHTNIILTLICRITCYS